MQGTEPGSRLPHCAIRLLSSEQASARQAIGETLTHARNRLISTHDLLDPGSLSLLLIAGQGSAAASWAAAAQDIDRESRLFRVVQIVGAVEPEQRTLAAAPPGTAVAADVSGQWRTLREVGPRSCCTD